MKTFALPHDARLHLAKANPRKEHHGEDLVQAISLRLRWTTTNEYLELVHPQLKAMLFWRPPELEAQGNVVGVPETTPCLRVPIVGLPLKVELAFSGYTLSIEHGIDESSALELYVCTLDKFTVDAKEGGSVIIEWSLASNKEITPKLIGELCSLEGQEISVTLTPPAIAAGVIDGTLEGFERDQARGRGEPDLLDHDHVEDYVSAERQAAKDAEIERLREEGGWPFPGGPTSEQKAPQDATDALLEDVAKNGPASTAKKSRRATAHG